MIKTSKNKAGIFKVKPQHYYHSEYLKVSWSEVIHKGKQNRKVFMGDKNIEGRNRSNIGGNINCRNIFQCPI